MVCGHDLGGIWITLRRGGASVYHPLECNKPRYHFGQCAYMDRKGGKMIVSTGQSEVAVNKKGSVATQ
jgi:hypothetical protein